MNATHNNALAYTDITMFFFEPHPKLGFKFSSISKKWMISEPYRLNQNDQRRQSNMSQVSQTSSQKAANNSTNVITTHEDTTKLKLIQEQKGLIDKQIDIQSLEKARLEAQCNLLKVQLVQVMEQMQQRMDQIQKMQFHNDENMDISNISKKLDDSDIIEPQKLLNQLNRTSQNNTNEKQVDKDLDDLEAEVQRI